jgi:acetyl esterase/lipase
MNASKWFAVMLSIPIASFGADEPAAVLLWPNGAPGSEGKSPQETVRTTPEGEHVVSMVHYPSITPYVPAKESATGAAVIVIPGGGHRELWMDHEGYNVAKWLRDRGVAAFVLKYRLARETNSTYQVDVHAFQDTQRALRLVRHRAADWSVNPNRVGAIGFSAGGELAALAAMRFDQGIEGTADPLDRESSRPDFLGLIYPGRSGSITVHSNMPPVFLACAYNDRPDISEGLANVYLKCKQAGVPAELHIFASGGHGFGLRDRNHGPVGQWVARFQEWLGDRGFLGKP